jgi:RNA 2',3'-cyclic 3'-phosphodiesterase
MVEKSASRRLFFAFWPDDSIREALAHATRKAARASGGRPVPPANLHSTVVFLGSVAEDRLASVIAIVGELRYPPLRLKFDRLEHWAKAAVLCLGCSQPQMAASVLATSLSKLLINQGFATDPKPYRPHVTIARKVARPHEIGPVHAIEWPIDEIALMESTTAPEGPHYSVLKQWPLRG